MFRYVGSTCGRWKEDRWILKVKLKMYKHVAPITERILGHLNILCGSGENSDEEVPRFTKWVIITLLCQR